MGKARRALVYICLVLGLAACLPEQVVTQPNLRLHILNDVGAPLPAEVTLHWWEYPYRRQRAVTQAATDAQGTVAFTERVTTEAMLYLVPHGVPAYNWTFCVRADGYKTLIGTVSNVAPGDVVEATFTLHPGDTLPVCEDFARLPYHAGSVVEAVEVTGGDVRGTYEVDAAE